MQTQVSKVGPVEVIALSGKVMGGRELDAFRQCVRELLAQGKTEILVNLKDVEWMNSMGLGAMVGAHVSVTNRQGRIAFCEIESVRHLLLRTRLYEVFDCYDTVDEGVASFAAEGYE